MQIAHIPFVQFLNDIGKQGDGIAVFHVIKGAVGGQAHTHALGAKDPDGHIHNLQQQAGAVWDAAAVVIGAVVAAVLQKLIQQIPIGPVDLYAVKARLFGILGGAVVILNHARNL